MPTTTVQISGTPNVNVANSPSVSVSNMPSEPYDVNVLSMPSEWGLIVKLLVGRGSKSIPSFFIASHPNAEKSYESAIKYCLENLID